MCGKLAAGAAIIAVLALLSRTAAAWNDTAHRVSAVIAYRMLDPPTRDWVCQVLKQHERFEEDFVSQMPGKIRDGDEEAKAVWTFSQAAIWPDMARGFAGEARAKFNHPTWHYVNLPVFLSGKDREFFEGKTLANTSTEWNPDAPQEDLNILQALDWADSVLDSDRPVKEKAIALCWTFHLVGDIHQPLHATALYSQVRFPSGDRGGNEIPIARHGNLHALWDDALGRSESFPNIQKIAAKLMADEAWAASARKAAAKMSPVVWRGESWADAREFVYTPEILQAVAAGEKNPEEHIEPIQLGKDCLTQVKEVSSERIVQSGYRLAKRLESYMNDCD